MALQVDTVFVWGTDLDRLIDWYAGMGTEPGCNDIQLLELA